MCLGLFYSLSAIVLLGQRNTLDDKKMIMQLEGIMIAGIAFWAFIGMIGGIIMGTAASDRDAAGTMVGSIGCAFGLAYYMAPLSTVYVIIKNRDARTLYAPMICINLVNAMLWVFYGAAGVNDPIIWGPNMIGIMLSVFQLLLIFLFRNPTGAQHSTVSVVDDIGAAPSINPMSADIVKSAHTAEAPHNGFAPEDYI